MVTAIFKNEKYIYYTWLPPVIKLKIKKMTTVCSQTPLKKCMYCVSGVQRFNFEVCS